MRPKTGFAQRTEEELQRGASRKEIRIGSSAFSVE
jgi:hypothetical protein